MDEFEMAKQDPYCIFSTPEEVLTHTEFTNQQKIEVLRRWEYDARELEVAEEENMGGDDVDILDRVLACLHQLDASVHLDNAPPTKQGGE